MIILKNSKIYSQKNKFNISNYKPFFVNEVPGFKLSRLPKLKYKKFWASKKYKEFKKFIMISGPGRSGNHLVASLIDPLSNIVGEDSFLTNIFCLANKNEKQLLKNLKSGNVKFYLSLSGYLKNGKRYNKWLDTYKIYEKIKFKSSNQKKLFLKNKKFIYSGTQKSGDKFDLDFRDYIPKLNYRGFENYFIENKQKFKKIKNFSEFIELYLNASQILVGVKKKNFYEKRFILASGMRRESSILLKKNLKQHILICPIRNFNEFALSLLVPILRKNKKRKIENNLNHLFLFYKMWFHKVIDYLILKKMYPKNVIIVRFEELISKREKIMKLIFKKIKEPIKKINLKPTILRKKVKGNSSHDFIKNKYLRVNQKYKKNLLSFLEKKIIYCEEYYDLLRHINKVKLK